MRTATTRVKNLIGLAVVVAAAAIFAHFWTTPPERLLAARTQPDPEAPEADSFMSGSETLRYDEHGALNYRLTASRTDFFLSDNRYEILLPEVEMISADGTRHRARSDRGNVLQAGEQILLDGNVVIWQHEPAHNRYELRTPKLWLYPEDRFAETDRPLTLLSDRGTTDGIGLRAYLNEQRFEILKDVKSIHQPL